jgi:hypothetical protein
MHPNIYIDPLPNNFQNYYLNGTAGMTFAGDFYRDKNGLYQSQDPRTIDVPRNMRTYYDSPPYQTPNTQPQQHLYSQPGSHTGFYDDYTNIRSGQIIYYTDVDRADPYSQPTYTIPSKTTPTRFQDPMGGLKTYYQKIPLFEDNYFLSEYSWDRDQMAFREDIISKQQEKSNSQEWDTYQLFNNPQKYFPNFPARRFNF